MIDRSDDVSVQERIKDIQRDNQRHLKAFVLAGRKGKKETVQQADEWDRLMYELKH